MLEIRGSEVCPRIDLVRLVVCRIEQGQHMIGAGLLGRILTLMSNLWKDRDQDQNQKEQQEFKNALEKDKSRVMGLDIRWLSSSSAARPITGGHSNMIQTHLTHRILQRLR